MRGLTCRRHAAAVETRVNHGLIKSSSSGGGARDDDTLLLAVVTSRIWRWIPARSGIQISIIPCIFQNYSLSTST